jgi:Patatin-like phospholipase
MSARTVLPGHPGTAAPPNDAARDPTQRWAICCSGGGIRSASYCLGALQRLEQGNILDKTAVILGVSGGSYIAASRALVAHGLRKDGLGPGAGRPAYAPGTPEEQHLRDNTRYLAPDAKTLLAGVLSLLLGVAVTLVLVLTPVFAVAHVWGWILRSTGTLAYATAAHSGAPHWTASVTAQAWWISPVIAAGVTLVVFLWFWASLVPGSRQREGHSQLLASALGWAAFLTLMLALAMLAVPELIAWLSGPHSGALKILLNDLGFGTGAAWTPAALTGFVMAIVAVSQSARHGLAKFNLLKAPGLAATVGGYLRTLLLPWLASALVVLAGFVAALRWVKDGAAAGFGAGQAWLVIGALAVMLAARILTDVNRISLHDFYRWRLASAYAVMREAAPRGGDPAPFGTRNAPGTRLSELSGDQPELVLCATANINAERQVPVGRGGMSFTFDARHATLRGPDPGHPLQALTTDYEALVGRRRLTLFDVSAISGAAFSPLMGAATQRAHRILFTATNLRLGVWLPHPAIVKAARQELADQQDPHKQDHRTDHWWHWLGLFAWYVLPHPLWRRGDDQREHKETRLWAYVLRLRETDAGWPGFFGALLYRALQPTLGMLYAEAAGHTSYRSTWMCVTDGGHYDNLGLVEALQRRAELGLTHILVLDASGDKANTFFTLGGSIALARCDAATEITLNPTEMIYPLEPGMSVLAQGQVVRPWATGTVTAPGGAPSSTIVVCKLGWWKTAPWDVCAYAAGHSSYPTESTLDQLYDFAEFDAYRELGWSAVDMAIDKGALPGDTASRQPQPAAGRPARPARAAGRHGT